MNCGTLAAERHAFVTDTFEAAAYVDLMETRQLNTLLSTFSLSFLGVALTLQLVWMVATPVTCGGMQSDLPVVANAIEFFESETDLAVTIRRDGFVFLGPALVPSSSLPEELSRRLSYGPRPGVRKC